MSDSSIGQTPVDITQLLDEGPFNSFQITVIVLSAATVVLDGFTNQLIGFAIPSVASEWAVTPQTFAPAVAAGLFGMSLGSVCFGPCADRFGRRRALIACVLTFGIFTSLVNLATSVASLSLLRFVASLGLGGAVPISSTMAAEVTPWRRRTLAVTATVVCYPLGGMVAGLVATRFLPSHGWRALFLLGGLASFALLGLLLFALPESPRFLAHRQHRWPELTRLLARMARPVAPDTAFTDASEQATTSQEGFSALFNARYRRDTFALSCAFFMCMFTVFSIFSWLPTMLVSAGLSGPTASSGLTAWNLGGVIGAILCAVFIARHGSLWPMLTGCAGAIASVLLVRQMDLEQHTMLLLYALGTHGLFINAVQAPMFALATFVYPTSIRATGTASAVAIGRMGAVLSAFAGAAVLTAAGPSGYFLMLAVAVSLVFVALALVRHHIPAAHGQRP